VTDQQYAILDGQLRHLPGGVDEYLTLAAARRPETRPAEAADAPAAPAPKAAGLSGAQLRAVHKEIAAIERALAKLADKIAAKHRQLAEHDQSDHVGVGGLTAELRALEDEVTDQEARWLELSERVD
jgi:flagellar motility protein MotE (MotC chaperone)